MNHRSLIFLVLLITAALLTAACGATTKVEAQTEAQPTAIPRTAVEVAPVETGSIASIFNYSGNLEAEADIELVPRVSGEIVEIFVKVGDEVQAGDPVAKIDDELLVIEVKNAELGLKRAQLELVKMEAGSRPEEVDAARSSYNIALSALNDTTTIDDNERTQAILNLAKAEAQLKKAQADYDKIAWAGQVAETPQAIALEQATADYEASLAAYNLQTNPSDAQLAPLQNNVVQARLNLTKAEEPFRSFDFDLTRTGIEQAGVSLERAELQLEYATIEAPFEGFIASIDIEEGSLVNAQTTIGRVVSKGIEVKVSVEENRLGQLFEGQPASLRVAAYPGREFRAVVSTIPPVADATTRTFDLTIIPEDEQNLLRSGMFADVSILAADKANALLAPRAAVTLVDGQPVVYVVVVEDDTTKAEQRAVTTGLRDGQFIEILSGVDEGETIVTVGQNNLVDGAEVAVIE